MYYAEIVRAVDRLKRRYHETDPFKLCAAMGIILIPQSLGTAQDAIKGFYLESKRIRTITVNSDMPLLFSAAASLEIPMELLDFKFRVMKWKGYKLVEPPIIARSNFLKDLEIPENNYYDW